MDEGMGWGGLVGRDGLGPRTRTGWTSGTSVTGRQVERDLLLEKRVKKSNGQKNGIEINFEMTCAHWVSILNFQKSF